VKILSVLAVFFIAFALLAQSVIFPGPGGVSGYKVASNARQFSGTSQYLQSSANVDLSSTKVVSISFFMYWDSFSDTDLLMAETSSNFNANTGAILIDPDDASGAYAYVLKLSAFYLRCTIARPSAAAWHHYLLILDNSSGTGTCTAYVDGSAVTATKVLDGDGTTTFGNYTLNLFSRNGASLFGAGRLSELAIWKSALTSGNASSLATYTAATSIDAGNLLFYWPIKGASPEVPTIGTPNLNVTGATAVAGPNP
jgi:concanavalin A-like lectin/glucanase superfamily protein